MKFYLSSVAVVIALVIAAILGIYGRNILMKKRAIAEIKEKAPSEKIEKLEKELKALEDAHKSGFISKESYEKERKRIEEKVGVSKK